MSSLSPRPSSSPSRSSVVLAVATWFSLALVFNWSSKSSLSIAPQPIAFTTLQILTVMLYAVAWSFISKNHIEPPSRKRAILPSLSSVLTLAEC